MTIHITLAAWRHWQAFRARLGEEITRPKPRAELVVLLAKARNYRPRDDMPDQWRADEHRREAGHRRHDGPAQRQPDVRATLRGARLAFPFEEAARLAELNRNEQEKRKEK